MGCHENALNYLRSLGYNVVLLPKADVAPLNMLSPAGRGTFDRFGRLDTVLVGDGSVALPPVARDIPAANVTGISSSSLKLGLGLSVLASIVAAMGGSPLGLEAAYSKAAAISFEFRDVYEDRVEVAALDRYLAAADVDPHSVHAAQLLVDNDLLVVTSTLKTATIAVRATDRAETALALDAPVVQDIVGAAVTVAATGQDTTLLSYAGPAVLVFGFQAVRLHYESGFYRAIKPVADIRMRAPLVDAPADGAERFLAPGPLVRLAGSGN
jgi:hypothetical protein